MIGGRLDARVTARIGARFRSREQHSAAEGSREIVVRCHMAWPARDPDLALAQLGMYFMGTSPLHDAAREISKHLQDAGIDYVIAGALCLNAHGVMRATEDIIITREGLERFKATWLGRGDVELRPGGSRCATPSAVSRSTS